MSRSTLRPGRAPVRPATAASIDALETPALLVDAAVLESNLRDMQDLADSAGVALRPHWKTHKCVELAARQLELGAVGGTVAKTSEAEVFLARDFRDVLVATPVVDPEKIERLLAARGDAELVVLVESEEGLRRWSAAASRSGRSIPVLMEVDVGMRRTGVRHGESALPLARAIAAARGVELRGVMTHAGHAYGAASAEEIARIGREEGERLVRTAEAIRADGIPCPVVSVGSTPTVRHSARVSGVTEIRPGNYVFHDRIQVGLGVVPEGRCALTVLATVTARPAPDRVVIDAGAKTLGNDRSAILTGFGCVLGGTETLERVSEEHGILAADPGSPWRVGDRLRIVPNHACIAVHLHERLHVTRGERVEAVWDVAARGRIA